MFSRSVQRAVAIASQPLRRLSSAPGPFSTIELHDIDKDVARIVLSRPEKRNALSFLTMTELCDALTAVAASPARAVVLEAKGPVFSSGHDLSELRTTDTARLSDIFSLCGRLMLSLRSLPQPVIASVNGLATAAGCQLVASCDIAVASSASKFATPGVKVGLFCSTPAVPIVRAVGPKRAMAMLLTGDPITASTALEWGLINAVVPAEELASAVDGWVAKIISSSPCTLAIGKAAFWSQVGLSEAEAYGVTVPAMVKNGATGDAQEGFGAFFEKRHPKWTGK